MISAFLRRPKILTPSILSLGFALTISVAARAELTPHDLFAPGDELVTRDSETGFDWLDLTETTGLSWNDILAGAGGWTGDGWRHATTAEMCEFMLHAGFALAPCPGPTNLPGAGAFMETWIGTIGETGPPPTATTATLGTVGWYDRGSEELVGMNLMLQIEADALVFVDHPSHMKDEARSYAGHHLIRLSPQSVPGLGAHGVFALASALTATAIIASTRVRRSQMKT